jgi:hypothetical protein
MRPAGQMPGLDGTEAGPERADGRSHDNIEDYLAWARHVRLRGGFERAEGACLNYKLD